MAESLSLDERASKRGCVELLNTAGREGGEAGKTLPEAAAVKYSAAANAHSDRHNHTSRDGAV